MSNKKEQCNCEACREEALLKGFTEQVNKIFSDLGIKLQESKVVALIDAMVSLGAIVQVAHDDDGEVILPPKFMIDTDGLGLESFAKVIH